jgi:hypothetical protein
LKNFEFLGESKQGPRARDSGIFSPKSTFAPITKCYGTGYLELRLGIAGFMVV